MSERLRVAVTVEQCWHRVPGGTATSILGMLGGLVDRDDLDLVGVAARHREPPPMGLVPPIPVRHLPLPRLALYEAWHGVRLPPVQLVTGRVDVVHATGVAMPPKRGPLVVTIHDLAFLDDPTLVTRHGNRFFRRATDLARRDADVVIVPSAATATECKRAGFATDRLRIVPWGVDIRPAPPEAVDAVRGRFGLHRPFVLFVGTLEPRKNLAGVLNAFARLPDDVDLVVAGPDGWNEDFAGRLAAIGSGVADRIHRLGFVDADVLRALYAACSVVCYPSIREGFGLPVLDAMAHGAPVVTSAGTATEEVAGDAAIVVDPRDVDAIATALATVIGDADLAAHLRIRGRSRAAQYTWEATADAVAAVYREVAG